MLHNVLSMHKSQVVLNIITQSAAGPIPVQLVTSDGFGRFLSPWVSSLGFAVFKKMINKLFPVTKCKIHWKSVETVAFEKSLIAYGPLLREYRTKKERDM